MQRALRHGASLLVSFTVNKGSPTLSPQGGRVLPANDGQDQRIVCACCRRLRPRLRSVSSRLTVCARCYRCVLDKPTEVGAVAKGIRPKGNRPNARRARQHAHTNNFTETDGSAKPNQTSRRQPPRPPKTCVHNSTVLHSAPKSALI